MQDILIFLSTVSAAVPLVVGFKNRRSLLWLYPLAGLSFDILTHLLKNTWKIDHNWLPNVFLFTEFVLISLIYKGQIFKSRRMFELFFFTLAGFFLFTTVTRSPDSLNVVGACFFSSAYIAYSLAGFYTIISEQQIHYLHRSSFFWQNVCFLIYASGTFLLFLFWNYLLRHDLGLLLSLWYTVFLLLNILKNLLLAIAIYYLNDKDGEPA